MYVHIRTNGPASQKAFGWFKTDTTDERRSGPASHHGLNHGYQLIVEVYGSPRTPSPASSSRRHIVCPIFRNKEERSNGGFL